MIRVIIVDDHRLFRMGIKSVFETRHPDIQVTGEADCGKELFAVLDSGPADLVLLDINLPDMGGAEIAGRIHRDYPAVKILAVSAENTVETIESMLEAGIDGFISKQKGDADELAVAIRTIMDGLEYYGRDISSIILGVYVAKKKTTEVSAEFTEREREIILACRDGLLCKEIADRMNVSVNTINTHKKRIFMKLGINNTMEMVQYALRNGIIIVALILLAGCTHNTVNKQNINFSDWQSVKIDSLEHLLATKQLPDSDLMHIHGKLAMGYEQISFDKTVFHAREGIVYAKKLNNPVALTDFFLRLGLVYYNFYTTQDDSAMYYYNKSLEQVPLIKNMRDADDLQSQIYGAIANLYNKQGNNREALNYYLMMLKILEKHGWKGNMIILYYNVGSIYLDLDNYEEAEKYFIKMQTLANETYNNKYQWKSEALLQLSKIYLHNKDYKKALDNATIAYKTIEEDPKMKNIYKIEPLQVLADINLKGYNNYNKAEEYANLAVRYSEDSKQPLLITQSLATLADVYLGKGMYRESERAALRALNTDSTYSSNNIDLFKTLAKANAFLGKTAKAMEYFDRYTNLTAERSNKNYMSALTEVQTKYETNKKELEIAQQQQIIVRQNLQRGLLAGGVAVSIVILALLWYMLRLRNRRNRALTERNDALAEMNATKDKFFSIISHDLKNPAIAQRDALQLLINNVGLWDVNALTDYYHELLKSADGQVELLYNLLSWAQLQTGRMTYTPTTFTLSDLLSDITLIRNMAKNKGITLNLPQSQEALITGDRNMLSTVIRNLLTNAVKFTPAGGTVTLNIFPCDPNRVSNPVRVGQYTISVSDTGVGMNEEQVRNLFKLDSRQSRLGTADEQGSGLGLIVCKELLEKHGSELHVESEEGKGSRFWFTISA